MRRSLTGRLPSDIVRSIGPIQIKDVGNPSQIKAGRELTNTDFTQMGLAAPRALWNLSGLTDASGNGFTLTDGGAGATTTTGIQGLATTAHNFDGSTTSHLTASNSLEQGFGTWGCWFKTEASAATQYLMSMYKSTTELNHYIFIQTNGTLRASISVSGSDSVCWFTDSFTSVADNRWHFVVMTWDGSQLKIYVDGRLDNNPKPTAAGSPAYGPAYTGSATALQYLGGAEINTSNRLVGKLDEAFITSDLLSEDQVRFLYCAKTILPTANVNNIYVKVNSYTRTSDYVSADFPTQPLVGYNLDTSGTPTTDNYGSLGKTLTANGGTIATDADVDTKRDKAPWLLNTTPQYYSASDASLPATTTARSIGMWFKNPVVSTLTPVFVSYGTNSSGQAVQFYTNPSGDLLYDNHTVGITTATVGAIAHKWTFAVVTVATTPRTSIYVDGSLFISNTTALNSTTLAGASAFRIGTNLTATTTSSVLGNIGGVFICDYALDSDAIRTLYNKQGIYLGSQILYDPSDVIYAVDSTYIYTDFTNYPGANSVEFVLS